VHVDARDVQVIVADADRRVGVADELRNENEETKNKETRNAVAARRNRFMGLVL
jgi:hypothetical protein